MVIAGCCVVLLGGRRACFSRARRAVLMEGQTRVAELDDGRRCSALGGDEGIGEAVAGIRPIFLAELRALGFRQLLLIRRL